MPTRVASAQTTVPRLTGRPTLGTLTLLLIAAAVALSGCGEKGEPAAAAIIPTTQPSELDVETQATTKLALAAYNGYLDSWVTASAKADWTNKKVDQFTADPLRTQIHLALRTYANGGVVFKGKPVSNPKITAVSLNTTPQWIMLADCLDASNWKPVLKTSGQSALAPGQLSKYLVTAKAVAYPDGKWYLQQVTAERNTPC